ncbi:SET domain-containing protein [Agrocybe pediades]|nr:SET domain-containing protein [Agrocybe pediades]
MNTDNDDQVHPKWHALLQWLASHGMDVSHDKLPVVARSSPGAGYGLFSIRQIEPSSRLFSIPAKALLNHLTLAPHYPPTKPKLSCTQIVSLHLMIHRPKDGVSSDPLFGPYISVIPTEFDSHPLTWLWKKKRNSECRVFEEQLLYALPEHVYAKLEKIMALYDQDWSRIRDYLEVNPSVLQMSTHKPDWKLLEADFLWGWLSVNTRCVYHRLSKSRADKNNMTLCPILDFANHAATAPSTKPETSRAELWDAGPSNKRPFGDNFVLLSPDVQTAGGQELMLRYGVHSNATLFAEYGFVDERSSQGASEMREGETEVIQAIEKLFINRGNVGAWMKQVLVDEGYWGDWTLHASSAPAHPSYRLMTALRLYHALPADLCDTVPDDTDRALQSWRNTTRGIQDNISAENEQAWRASLFTICKDILHQAKEGAEKVRQIDSVEISPPWLGYMKRAIEMMWKEDSGVAQGIIDSLTRKEEF